MFVQNQLQAGVNLWCGIVHYLNVMELDNDAWVAFLQELFHMVKAYNLWRISLNLFEGMCLAIFSEIHVDLLKIHVDWTQSV